MVLLRRRKVVLDETLMKTEFVVSWSNSVMAFCGRTVTKMQKEPKLQ